MDGVVIFERITGLVHEEDARHIALGERVVVAVTGQFLTVQCLEITLFGVDLLELCETLNAFLAHLAI